MSRIDLTKRIEAASLDMAFQENKHFEATGHTRFGPLQRRDEGMIISFYKQCLDCLESGK